MWPANYFQEAETMADRNSGVLVIGATGQQGGAVARHLLSRGWVVRGFVRDLDKPAARTLANRGAALVRGNLDDPASIRAAMEGMYGVFSMQTQPESSGVWGETQQGKTVAEIASAAGVDHLVYSSVGGAERDTGIPHFESKWQIEQHIRKLGLPATIFRPAFFAENFAAFLGPKLVDGTLVVRLPIHQETTLQMIAVDDIGAFVADAFDNPREYLGQELELAGDELDGTGLVEVFGRITGLPTQYVEQPIAEIRAFNADAAAMFEWFDESGYQADIAALRRRRPDLCTLETWLRTISWSPTGAQHH
jgi:uncharacterized protein YbjT (DUF2867 family)